MLNNFDKYYDLIFADKNYKKEVSYILKKTKKIRIKKILDIGCGTGTHADLIHKSIKKKIIGLDKNKKLIGIAKKKNNDINFKNVYLKKLNEKNFELIISMFNVVNYFKDYKKLILFFKEVKKKTTKNSLFIFDSWNGSFNFKKKIVKEKRTVKRKDFFLINQMKSTKKLHSNKILLNYKILINFFEKNKKINIKHQLIQFLWKPDEIKKALILAGFNSVLINKSFSDTVFGKNDLKIIFLAKS